MKESYKIRQILTELYKDKADSLYDDLESLVTKYEKTKGNAELSQKDCMLITYGDSIKSKEMSPLLCLHQFLKDYVGESISAVHLLPFFPYSSDDGFSVIDYEAVNPSMGSWEDIDQLSKDYDLMFDGVINHISCESSWVKGYITGDNRYAQYFIECDKTMDYSQVIRPRALPLLTEVSTHKGLVNIWTTFSEDQWDLNYKEPKVFLNIIDILLMYVSRGARYLRLDAIGFLWKELGTSCMHLKQTHQIIRLMRLIIEEVNPKIILITETNTPHLENISYFGNGYDEAHMVYQFPLPPLTLYTFLEHDSGLLLRWLQDIKSPSESTTFFNFLSSHDGIGLRPLEGILEQSEVNKIAELVKSRGGRVSYRTTSDGGQLPYELNINYLDALCDEAMTVDEKVAKFIASQAILLSIVGVPGIYIHSLLGSRNDLKGVEDSGINRRINREKLQIEDLSKALNNKDTLQAKVFTKFKELLNIRKEHTAFSPNAKQKVVWVDHRLFTIIRENRVSSEKIEVFINVTKQELMIKGGGFNLITNTEMSTSYTMKPYEVVWRMKNTR